MCGAQVERRLAASVALLQPGDIAALTRHYYGSDGDAYDRELDRGETVRLLEVFDEFQGERWWWVTLDGVNRLGVMESALRFVER